ncbi:1-phosphofructokinase [Arthrobacter sp. UYP6]|uniref:1-phosphofructokinase family hexose kinase n=1 Tax=Arthrobacter sp. UYP6 TaxID=1756378 RepID=UPI003397A26B
MIVTLTVNPSLDRTIELPGALLRGAVQRAAAISEDPGGKGVNVSRALTVSGLQSIAVLPGRDDDPVMGLLRGAGVSYANLPIAAPVRSNITLTEPDGTTTKINMPGPPLDAADQEALISLLVTTCAAGEKGSAASWLVLAGSLPPGASPDLYALVAHAVRRRFGDGAPRIAIDSSGPPLLGALRHNAAPDLLKPNAEELAEVTGIGTEDELEADPLLAVGAARTLIARGVGAVLATLGPKGALLVTAGGAWQATRAPVAPRSTVGAGDSSLAGYLLADVAGAPPRDCLRQAVAHGAAAASLPGTTVPTLAQTDPGAVTVAELEGPPAVPGTGATRTASTKEED